MRGEKPSCFCFATYWLRSIPDRERERKELSVEMVISVSDVGALTRPEWEPAAAAAVELKGLLGRKFPMAGQKRQTKWHIRHATPSAHSEKRNATYYLNSSFAIPELGQKCVSFFLLFRRKVLFRRRRDLIDPARLFFFRFSFDLKTLSSYANWVKRGKERKIRRADI